MFVVEILLAVLAALLCLVALYRWTLWWLDLLTESCAGAREGEAPSAAGPWPPVTILVPAHDEEPLLAACLDSLQGQDYPPEKVRVVVLADRCGDRTAQVAAERGVEVLERAEGRPGKGSLLRWALPGVLEGEEKGGLLALVDADSSASRGLLRDCAARILGGAPVVQAHHGVRGAGSSLLGCLMDASARVRRRVLASRDRLGLAAPLLGTGMVFRRQVLEGGWETEGLAEDRELGALLVLRGIRPRFAATSEVLSEGPGGLAGARTQRLRWVRGEASVARRLVLPLIRKAVAGKPGERAAPLELALDLLLPSLSVRAGLLAALWLLAFPAGLRGVWLPASVGLLLEAVPFLAGLVRYGPRGAAALLAAPLFVLWKGVLVLEAAWPGRHPWRPTREGRR